MVPFLNKLAMVSKEVEHVMEEMHRRLVIKYRYPKLFDLMDFYQETEQTLTDRFKVANTTEEKVFHR